MSATPTSIESERPRANLRRRFMLLSASFPSQEQSPSDFANADASEISQAVVAITRAVISSNGRLVFGGHPTITPLVLTVAQEYLPEDLAERQAIRDRRDSSVLVYQSEVFTPFVPEPIKNLVKWNLGEVIETGRAQGEDPAFTRTGKLIPGSATKSLETMRTKMIEDANPLAAFFVGGMQGIRDEASMCRRLHTHCRLFYIGAPGGAARRLAEENLSTYQGPYQEFARDMLNSRNYPALAQNLIRLLSSELPHDSLS